MVCGGFGGFGSVCLLVLVVCGRAPLGHPLPFPLISIRFGSVFGCFGCFCLVIFVVFGRVLLGHTLPFPVISIRFDGCGGFACFLVVFCCFW